MTDSEFITRADVERVRDDIQEFLQDMDHLMESDNHDMTTMLHTNVYAVIHGVLDNLLEPGEQCSEPVDGLRPGEVVGRTFPRMI